MLFLLINYRGKYDTTVYHLDSMYCSVLKKARKDFDDNGKTIDSRG